MWPQENLGKDKWHFLKTCLPRFLFNIGEIGGDQKHAHRPPAAAAAAATTASGEAVDADEEEWEEVTLASFMGPVLLHLLRTVRRA
jgi:hypothetical protein